LKEDLRHVHCWSPCTAGSRIKAAAENTFAARRGQDGHESFSVARLAGPVTGGLVASYWLPGKFTGGEAVRVIGVTYAFDFLTNLVVELFHR